MPKISGSRRQSTAADSGRPFNPRSADSLSAELLGKWERNAANAVFVVGVKASVYLPFAKHEMRLHEYRVLYFADNLLEARLQLMGWKFFAQKHKISLFLPVQSESLARLGACDFVRARSTEQLADWVNPGGRWDGKEKRWHRERQAARWHG